MALAADAHNRRRSPDSAYVNCAGTIRCSCDSVFRAPCCRRCAPRAVSSAARVACPAFRTACRWRPVTRP